MGSRFYRYILIYCLWLCAVSHLLADTTVVLSNRRNEDLRHWTALGSAADVRVLQHDGGLRILSDSPSSMRIVGTEAILPAHENWRIDIALRILGRRGGDTLGILAYGAPRGSGLVLVTSADARAYLGESRAAMAPAKQKWVQTASSIDSSSLIVLSLMKKNDAIVGYRNSIPVATYSSTMVRDVGSLIGVVTVGKCDVVLERCDVVSWGLEPVRVVDGATANEQPVRLGSGINTDHDESVDCISPDGSQMFFSREERIDDIRLTQRDVWVTHLTKDGWSEPTKLGATVNTEANDYAVAITEDMSTLFLQGRYGPYGREPAGLSYVMKVGSAWSTPVNMHIDDEVNDGPVINSHLSSDGRVLVSSRQTPDTYGGNDLYVSFRVGVDTWSKPVNMGPVINTHGMELGPFIAGDNETMFFSSNGHPGFGGRDIFVTRRLDSTWLSWSEPENLGPSLNGVQHETFLQVPARGDSAYFSTHVAGSFGDDIVALPLPYGAQPKSTYTIQGLIVDAITNTPLKADVVLVLMPSERFEISGVSDSATGSINLRVATASLYQIQIAVPGYKRFVAMVDARGIRRYTTLTTRIKLERAPEQSRNRFDTVNVSFTVGKASIDDESMRMLDDVASQLRSEPGLQLILRGHTDAVGPARSNMLLSYDRARRVQAYLQQAGVDESRCTVVGYGESAPRATNATAQGRAKNRRVEVIVQ